MVFESDCSLPVSHIILDGRSMMQVLFCFYIFCLTPGLSYLKKVKKLRLRDRKKYEESPHLCIEDAHHHAWQNNHWGVICRMHEGPYKHLHVRPGPLWRVSHIIFAIIQIRLKSSLEYVVQFECTFPILIISVKKKTSVEN